jgi:capsular exopolysaccharide synthesis family protein
MSKFFKALDQAQRDRALREQSQARPAPPSALHPVPPPVAEPREHRPAPPVAPAPEPRPAPEPAPPPPFRRPEPSWQPPMPAEGVDDHLVSLVTPAAFEAEQYRALRHMVEQQHKADGLTVIAVSSPAVGDGKTTTAINLAGALGQAAEARVLLVEADLRRPSVGRLLGFGEDSGRGLVHAIMDRGLSLGQVVRPRPPFNVHVILAGQIPPSPYEILKSPRLGELLEEARQQYDYVIVDTPPLVGIQDSRVVARWIDGLLVVVAAHRTPRRLVDEALSVVDSAKVLGLVFNGDDPLLPLARTGYYAGYHHAGYHPVDGKGSGRLGRAIGKLGASLSRRERRAFERDPDQDDE